MNFQDPRVAAALERYRARDLDEQVRMRALGPALFATRDEFLLPIGEAVGTFLHALIVAKRPRTIVELGTSYGYSTLFLADAARTVGATVITMDKADYKQARAREEIERAGLGAQVKWRCGDAVELIRAEDRPFDLVLLDIWKDLYLPCFEAFYPKLSEEAVIAADNMIDPPFERENVRSYRSAVRAKPDMTTVLLPIGSGIELSARWSVGNPKL